MRNSPKSAHHSYYQPAALPRLQPDVRERHIRQLIDILVRAWREKPEMVGEVVGYAVFCIGIIFYIHNAFKLRVIKSCDI